MLLNLPHTLKGHVTAKSMERQGEVKQEQGVVVREEVKEEARADMVKERKLRGMQKYSLVK